MMKSQFFLVTLFCVALGSSVFAQTKPVEPVLQDFRKWAQTEGFAQADVQNLRVTDDYVTQHNQVRHLYVQQVYKGIGIVNSNAAVHVWKGKIVAKHQNLVKGLAGKASSPQPSLTASAALKKLAEHHNWGKIADVKVESVAKGLEQKGTFAANEIAYDAIPFQLVYYADKKGNLTLGWNMQVHTLTGQHYYNSIVDAASGKILFEEDWILKCNVQINHTHEGDAHMNLFEEEFMHGPRANSLEEANMMTAQYRVLAIPAESPNHGPYVLIQDPSDSIASPFGWHDTDGVTGPEFTITRGNNVWASEDRDANNVPGFSPDGGANLDFDFLYDTSVGPDQNQEAVITNLFYMNNIMHDVWYQYGFDEPSGNFQINNYGRGGSGSDAVRADAQDGRGVNNATFGTPPDGSNPVMTMFAWIKGDYRKFLSVNSPTEIAGLYETTTAILGLDDDNNRGRIGPGIPFQPITGNLVLGEDGSGNNEGCDSLTNVGEINGNIVVLDRGTCQFGTKALNAENAGAIAIILINNTGGLSEMPPGSDGSQVRIPIFMITQTAGTAIRAEILNGVNVTLSLELPLDAADRDSDLDNGIMAHEYGHGISNRLTGGPAAAGCLSNEEQAGEGWSDWFSLVMQVKPGDQGSDSRGIGTYSTGQGTDGGGIRTYPYSTDMSISLYTYNDVKGLSIPHGVGSVMCSMLWDLYWAMTDEHGYDNDIYNGTGGNNMAMRLVIDGMKLQPCAPGFVDVRDAILLADEINYGSKNKNIIWKVFARRGLGFSASQGSPFSRSDGSEAFDLPYFAQDHLVIEKRVDNNLVINDDTVTFSVFVSNQTDSLQTNVIVTDTLSNELVYVNSSSSINFSLSGNVFSFNLGSLSVGQDTIFNYQAIVASNKPFVSPIFFSDVEGDISDFNVIDREGTAIWDTTTVKSFSPPTSWFVPNVAGNNNQTLRTPVFSLGENSILSFWHYYDTEISYDGGVVEILANGKWQDLEKKMWQHPYNNILGDGTKAGQSTTDGQRGFSGDSEEWVETIIDLSEFAGINTLISFHFGSDEFAAETGWYIDDISVQERVFVSSKACVGSNEGANHCSEPKRPIAILITDIVNSVHDLPSAVALKLYPNPAKQQVTLEYLGTSLEVLEVEFRNTLGQVVKTLEMKPFTNTATKHIDISELPAGIYNISISQGDNRTIKKLLVE